MPGSLFEQLEARVARQNVADAYLLRWVFPMMPTLPPGHWREIYRTQGNPALALFSPEPTAR